MSGPASVPLSARWPETPGWTCPARCAYQARCSCVRAEAASAPGQRQGQPACWVPDPAAHLHAPERCLLAGAHAWTDLPLNTFFHRAHPSSSPRRHPHCPHGCRGAAQCGAAGGASGAEGPGWRDGALQVCRAECSACPCPACGAPGCARAVPGCGRRRFGLADRPRQLGSFLVQGGLRAVVRVQGRVVAPRGRPTQPRALHSARHASAARCVGTAGWAAFHWGRSSGCSARVGPRCAPARYPSSCEQGRAWCVRVRQRSPPLPPDLSGLDMLPGCRPPQSWGVRALPVSAAPA